MNIGEFILKCRLMDLTVDSDPEYEGKKELPVSYLTIRYRENIVMYRGLVVHNHVDFDRWFTSLYKRLEGIKKHE